MALRSLLRRFTKAHIGHHAIARGMAWVALLVMLGSLARVGKEVAIAYRYGVSAEVDAYLFVFNLVNWPVIVWFSVLTVVLVPMLTRLHAESAVQLSLFRSEFTGLAILIGLCLAGLSGLGLPWLLNSGWSGLPETTVSLAIDMVTVMAPLAFLGIMVSMFSVWILASGSHMNTLMESVPALVILLALLTMPTQSVEVLLWSTLGGTVLHLLALITPLYSCGQIESPSFRRHSACWPHFWQGFATMLVGQLLMGATSLIDQFFAAHLDAGAMATQSYANRVLTLILCLGGTSVSRATLPVFSNPVLVSGQSKKAIVARWVGILFVIGLALLVIGWQLAPWGIGLLFERGAFTARDTEAVADLFRFSLLQVPFYFSGMALVSYLASQSRYREISLVAGVNLGVKVLGNFALMPLLGLNGLAVSATLMYFTSLLLCWREVRRA